MITFSNIPESVQKTLFDRMDMLDKNKLTKIGEPITSDNGNLKENYMFTRSTFMRMVSLQPPASNPRPVILSGGEADHKGNLVGNLWGKKTSEMVSAGTHKDGTRYYEPGADIFNTVVNHGRYWAEGDSQPFRPMPGVKDVSVEYKGGGRTLAATRVAEINWTCWTYEDLDRLTPHFLHTGNTVFIDWGWTGVGDISPTNVDLFPIFKENDDGELEFEEPYVTRKGKKVPLLSTLPDHIINQKGNYDAMIGIVQDFEWSVRDDGGFDCVTTIISTGVNILQQSLKTSSDPRLTTLPLIIKDTTTRTDKGVTQAGTALRSTAYGLFGGAALSGAGVITAAAAVPMLIGGGVAAVGSFIVDHLFAEDTVWVSPSLIGPFEEVEKFDVDPTYRRDLSQGLEVKKDNVVGGKINKHYIGSFAGTELLKKISPYITFDVYIKDLYNQLYKTLKLNPEVMKSGHIIRIRSNINPGFVGEGESEEGKFKTNDGGLYVIDELYVTWGWFEDNVLSRFFSRTVDTGQGVIGEFRSYEEKYDASGDFLENVPVKIRNHDQLLSTDLTKFLLIKENDPIFTWVRGIWKNGWRAYDHEYHVEGYKGNKVWSNSMFNQSPDANIGEMFLESPLDDNDEVKLHIFDDEEDGSFKSDTGILRNVYFNARHLMEKMSDEGSIESAIQAVWDDFSAEYGGIYDFYLDYSDDQNRIVVKDRGWTLNAVKDAIDNKSHPADPDVAENETPGSYTGGLFEFPTWKKNSIVKSQNLSARLPDRMKLVAMYGASNLPEGEDSFKSSHHEDQSGLAWGQLTAPVNPELEREGLTNAEYERKVLQAAMVGQIDYPWRNNRSFGSKTANIDKELYIQQLNGRELGSGLSEGDGTIMYDTIIQKIMDKEYAEYVQNLKEISKATKGTETIGETLDQMKETMLDRKREWLNIIKLRGTSNLTSGQLFGLYQTKKEDDRVGGPLGPDIWGKSRSFKLGSAFKEFMMKEIRGHGGIPSKTDPIVPIEFELDVDGVAGIFPGNAFQSSYLPEKYKKIACFQVMGVNQKLDSSGWSSTVKGQIRVSVPEGLPPEPEEIPPKKTEAEIKQENLDKAVKNMENLLPAYNPKLSPEGAHKLLKIMDPMKAAKLEAAS